MRGAAPGVQVGRGGCELARKVVTRWAEGRQPAGAGREPGETAGGSGSWREGAVGCPPMFEQDGYGEVAATGGAMFPFFA
jgi:hypothetical protein